MLWAELHTFALTGPTAEQLAVFLLAFTPRIPCGDCRTNWLAWLTAHPPPAGAALFPWSVAAHNAVRKLQRKPELSESEARERWSPVKT